MKKKNGSIKYALVLNKVFFFSKRRNKTDTWHYLLYLTLKVSYFLRCCKYKRESDNNKIFFFTLYPFSSHKNVFKTLFFTFYLRSTYKVTLHCPHIKQHLKQVLSFRTAFFKSKYKKKRKIRNIKWELFFVLLSNRIEAKYCNNKMWELG